LANRSRCSPSAEPAVASTPKPPTRPAPNSKPCRGRPRRMRPPSLGLPRQSLQRRARGRSRSAGPGSTAGRGRRRAGCSSCGSRRRSRPAPTGRRRAWRRAAAGPAPPGTRLLSLARRQSGRRCASRALAPRLRESPGAGATVTRRPSAAGRVPRSTVAPHPLADRRGAGRRNTARLRAAQERGIRHAIGCARHRRVTPDRDIPAAMKHSVPRPMSRIVSMFPQARLAARHRVDRSISRPEYFPHSGHPEVRSFEPVRKPIFRPATGFARHRAGAPDVRRRLGALRPHGRPPAAKRAGAEIAVVGSPSA
jgi:hypothetical protein